MVRGIRGAITVEEDTPEAIHQATRELLLKMLEANGIQSYEELAAVIFTVTEDLTSAFPAEAARQMEIINGVNAELARLDDGKDVRFLDINRVFLGQDGKIPFSIMPDQLHPNAAGYQLWADAMQPTLTALMK